MSRGVRTRPIDSEAKAELTALLMLGLYVREVAERTGYSADVVSRVRARLVTMGVLEANGRIQPAPRHHKRHRPISPQVPAHPAVKTGSAFIAPIPLSRLMAGR